MKKVYIVCGCIYNYHVIRFEEYIVKVFDSEDKAIDFIQKLVSKKIGNENCIFNEVPSKEYIREHGSGIAYEKDSVYEYYYTYRSYNVH